ncbi:MAG TPA: autotransporter outer membrane beta-barrel domain-containing protein, partial [Hyphomicrobium sp.]|nr:autotransporter outer membrane beta-barrel domain-containing protein [Hyphomicrobium sp.]
TVDGHAAIANGNGSTITFANGAALSTTGTGSGLVAIGGGAVINATGVTVNNLGNAAVNVTGGHGAIAEGGGIVNLHAGTTIATGALNAVGLGASGAGSRVNADSLIPVTMNGRGAMGVYVHDGGQVTLLPGSTLQMNATSSVGITADNTSVALGTFGSGLTINLDGVGGAGQPGSTGIAAVNGGSIAIADVTIQGQNAAAGAWAAAGSSISISGSSTIEINSAHNQTIYTLATPYLVTQSGQVGSIFSVTAALPMSGLFTSGGQITSVGTTINVTSASGAGAFASNGGVVDMTDNTITTTGTASVGIEASGTGRVVANASRITTSGGGATASILGAGTVEVTNSVLMAAGAGTRGLDANNYLAAGTASFSMSGGSLESTGASALLGRGPLQITLTDGAMASGDGLILEALDSIGPQQTNVQLMASGGSVLSGSALAATNSIVDIDLATGARWTGAALDVRNVEVDATSVWSITETSILRDTLTNAGQVAFVPPGSGPFRTLTTPNYVGNGGTLGLFTVLGGDGAPSNRLVIDGGTATGVSQLQITNAGGAGALTAGNGILVVEAINGGSTHPGLLTLASPVVAGAYDYFLHRSSLDGLAADNWYLRSDYRAETSLYAALPAMSLLYGRLLLDTLQERRGSEKNSAAAGAPNGAWGRVIGQHGDRDGDGGPQYDYDFWALQAGTDLFRNLNADGSRDRAGAFFAIGNGDGDVTHVNGIHAGENSFMAYSWGAYWTHYTPQNAYIDTVLMGTWYDADAKSARLEKLTTEGIAFGASVEGGIPFSFGDFAVEPQVQVVYQTIDLDDGSDIGGSVAFSDAKSLLGRVGIRFVQTLGPGGFTAWVRPNLWYEFLGDPKVAFAGAGPAPILADLSGTTFEVNTGFTAPISANADIYADASYLVGIGDNDGEAYNGKIGVKVAW